MKSGLLSMQTFHNEKQSQNTSFFPLAFSLNKNHIGFDKIIYTSKTDKDDYREIKHVCMYVAGHNINA